MTNGLTSVIAKVVGQGRVVDFATYRNGKDVYEPRASEAGWKDFTVGVP